MAFARLVAHYWRHAAWLDEGLLLRGAARLAGVPGVLVHGRLDVSSPPDIAWALARAWPGSELTLVDNAGHGAGHADASEILIQATDRFSRRDCILAEPPWRLSRPDFTTRRRRLVDKCAAS